MSMRDLRKEYTWDVTCQTSVPVAIRCFLESENYESFLRNVISLYCDTDTLCAIGGCIAEEYYGGTGFFRWNSSEKVFGSKIIRYRYKLRGEEYESNYRYGKS
mgnify:CR=1 FL=1